MRGRTAAATSPNTPWPGLDPGADPRLTNPLTASGLLNLSPSSARFYTNRWDLTWNTRTSPLRRSGGRPRWR